MLTVKEKGILFYIVEHCERVEQKMVNANRQMLDTDLDFKEIVCFNIFQIDELAKGLSSDFINTYNGVPWKDIKGMRDFIGHGYGTIDLDKVWKTASSDINPLKEYCKKLIKD